MSSGKTRSDRERRRALARKKRKELQRIWHQRYIRIFTYLFAALLAVSVLLIPIRPKESDLEKRELAKFPGLSLTGIFTGTWFSDIDTWFSDTFPFREQLLACQSGVEKLYGLKGEELYGSAGQGDEIPDSAELAPVLLPPSEGDDSGNNDASQEGAVQENTSEEGIVSEEGQAAEETAPDQAETPAEEEPTEDGTIHNQGEVAGTVYIAENRGFEIYYFSNSSAVAYASMLNTVHAILGDSVTIYDMLAPTSFAVCLDEETQLSLGGSSTRDAFNYTYSMLDPAIQQVPVLDTLIKHNAEYVYYNTDHHWTQLGAYYSYVEFCKAKGISAHDITEFRESQYPGFLGTFYSYSNQSEALGNNPDTLVTYTPNGTNDCIISDGQGYEYNYPVVDDATEYSTGGKYSAFIGGDHALTTINNPSITDGSSCVVVKESYGNAFVPFLVDHYQTVYVVDYRYYPNNLTTFIQQNNVSDVIFLNNADAILQSNAETMLSMFM
ncbi:MAG: DHHW family protein [Lachnospiraceae bacterium]|nr:DHHW family protein [Lachnospiraceae bacterium]